MKSGYKKWPGILVLFTVLFVVPGLARAGDSDLDPTFGTGGLAQVTVGTTAGEGGKIALQSDGKIVQVGFSKTEAISFTDIAVVRYNANGSLDTTFDGDGRVVTDFGSLFPTYYEDTGNAIAIQSDGKIVVGGATRKTVYPASFQWDSWDVALVRYNTNGSLDTTFGDGGKRVVDLGSAQGINDIALQSDGKIIAVGYTMAGFDNRFLVQRFTTNGTLDTTFGTNGSVVTHFTENILEDAYSVAVLDDDSIIVAGRGIQTDGKTSFSLLKLTAAGALDTSFSGDGKLAVTVGDPAAPALNG